MYFDLNEIKADQQLAACIVKNEDDLNIQPSPGIHYGYMWFSKYDIHGIYVTDSKVLKTDDDIHIVTNFIHDSILNKLDKDIIGTFLFYQVENINPNIVSYQLITRSNFPYVTIYLRDRRHKHFCYFKGDSELYDVLYNNLPFLMDYNDTMKVLYTMKKKALKREHYIVYINKKVNFMTKEAIIRELLKNKRREFIKNY